MNIWSRAQHWAHQHSKGFHHAHTSAHLAYFGMVATHGPYNWVAAVLFIIVLLMALFKLEEV